MEKVWRTLGQGEGEEGGGGRKGPGKRECYLIASDMVAEGERGVVGAGREAWACEVWFGRMILDL